MCRKGIKSKKGFTLVELIAAIAITAIVGAMTATLFILPQNLLSGGGNLSNVQFNLRMISDTITNEVRLASAVEILPTGATIPAAADIVAYDKYIFTGNSGKALVIRDKDGDHLLFHADVLNLNFSVSASLKTLVYTISGLQEKETFELTSSVAALNLPSDQNILDSSGVSNGTIIKIEKNKPVVEETGLYFVMQSPNEGTLNQPYFRSLTAYGNTGLYSYSFVSGEMPPGITLGTASIAGTPTTIGSYTFSIRITDSITSTVRTLLINVVSDSVIPVPVASDLALSGVLQNGNTVTGTYVYTDISGSLEGISTTIWYRMDDVNGTNKTAIVSAPSTSAVPSTYTITSSDAGKYIAFQVTPVTADIRTGSPVMSTPLLVPANQAPTAEPVTITPVNPVVGNLLTGSYVYDDVDGDTEAGTTFQWYTIDNKGVLVPISGAINKTYQTTSSDKNSTICFKVTPRALTGNKIGDSVVSTNVKVLNK